ncbi:1631_t:CDS:2, partial [Cetraspora pellucida]
EDVRLVYLSNKHLPPLCPTTITPTINGIINYLNIISDAGNRLERLVLEIYPRANARAINAENRVVDLQTQLTNLQTQIADSQTQLATLQNDYDLLYQAYRAHKLNYHLLKATCIEKNKHILELLQEKFVSRLLNRQFQIQAQQNSQQLQNFAEDLTSIAPLIAKIPNYSRQILPDEWYQRINQILTLLSIMVAAFDNPLRANTLKSKIAGKYTNIPAQHT